LHTTGAMQVPRSFRMALGTCVQDVVVSLGGIAMLTSNVGACGKVDVAPLRVSVCGTCDLLSRVHVGWVFVDPSAMR